MIGDSRYYLLYWYSAAYQWHKNSLFNYKEYENAFDNKNCTIDTDEELAHLIGWAIVYMERMPDPNDLILQLNYFRTI